MLTIRTLASSSSGNATFVRAGPVAFLIDAGVSNRRIAAALDELGESLAALDGVLITHEHRDHVGGLPMIRRSHPDLPIFATAGTARACARLYGWHDVRFERLRPGRPLGVGGVQVTPVRVRHDACEPVGFRIDATGCRLGFLTDLGCAGGTVRRALHDCDILIVEANYDEAMLEHGSYPPAIKRRIASARGHLSNHQVRGLLKQLAGRRLRKVVLGHLSQENNTGRRALELVGPALHERPHLELTVAPREAPGPVIEVRASRPFRTQHAVAVPAARQLSLDFDKPRA